MEESPGGGQARNPHASWPMLMTPDEWHAYVMQVGQEGIRARLRVPPPTHDWAAAAQYARLLNSWLSYQCRPPPKSKRAEKRDRQKSKKRAEGQAMMDKVWTPSVSVHERELRDSLNREYASISPEDKQALRERYHKLCSELQGGDR